MFIAYSLIKFQDHGHRKKTQAILALIKGLLKILLVLLVVDELLITNENLTVYTRSTTPSSNIQSSEQSYTRQTNRFN